MAFDSRSPSQIETWLGCRRKYGWSYVMGIRGAQTLSQKLGTEVDDGCLQPYFRNDIPLPDTDAGRIAATALEWLPTPADAKAAGCTQQFKIRLPGARGAPWYYNGYEDFDVPVGGLLPKWSAGADDAPAVVDFKTCKTFSYALNTETIKTNPQAVLYALNTMHRLKTDKVRLRWIYMRTTGKPKAQVTDAVLTQAEAIPVFLELEVTAAEIHEYLQNAPYRKYGELGGPEHEAYVLATEPNPEHCDAFGGCDHKFRCNLSPAQMTDSITVKEFDVEENAVVAKLKAKRAAALGAVEPTKVVVGVNPPEKDLPPPPVEVAPVIETPTLPPVENTATPIGAEPKKRGRPRKAAVEPRGEEVVTPVETQRFITAEEAAKSGAKMVSEDLLEHPADNDTRASLRSAGDTFSVTWGEERFLAPGDGFRESFVVGPFHANGTVLPGETLVDAMRRVEAKLNAFAVVNRAEKAASFAKFKGAA
jgi:hypothetical protein